MQAPSRAPAMTGLRRGDAPGIAGLLSRSGDRLRTDPAILQALPGMRHRAIALLQAMPDGWWRGTTHGTAVEAQP